MQTLYGVIVENLPNASFRVKFADREETILCHLSGKMRLRRFMRLLPGDKVQVEVVADYSLGRIISRIR